MQNCIFSIALLISCFVFNAQAVSSQITPDFNDIWIPMRDGDSLSADVYIPNASATCQVILIQTPYNKNTYENGLPLGVLSNLDNQPFGFVVVDWRGFYGSNQADLSNVNRGEDGYDVCEWISNQPWSAGRIGTWGPSALGNIQYLTLAENHPNHTCAVPQVAHAQQAYDQYFTGGVLEEARLNSLDALGFGVSTVIYANPYYNNLWASVESSSWYAPLVSKPTLQIGGWYDHNIDRMIDFYKSTREDADPSVRDLQWLLVGPWVHGGTGPAFVGSSVQGELSYPNAARKSDSMALDFFRYYLLDSANNWLSTSKVTHYETGTNEWRYSESPDFAKTQQSTLYFNGFGTLDVFSGAGQTSFFGVPNDPTPTLGGATLSTNLDQGPYDQTDLETRNDVRFFGTENLASEVNVVGRAKFDLKFSSELKDFDVMLRLVDVYPDGRKMLITDGARRMRFRNGYTQNDEEFMVDGEVYSVEIDLPFINYTWKEGHQIGVYLSASNAARFHVNRQDGGDMYTGSTKVNGVIRLHHEAGNLSSLQLPTESTQLSISKQTNDENWMYPNPVQDELFLKNSEQIKQAKIIDSFVKIVAVSSFDNNSINVSDLTPGIYFVEIQLKSGELRLGKVVVE
ncbi:MAG: putative acyl esterase [Lentimonas sp.]|jgi:predicted acyl esterase